MTLLPEPLPVNDPLVYKRRPGLRPDEVDEREDHITTTWIESLSAQAQLVAQAPNRIALVELPGTQSASIATTSLVADVASGLYRITYNVRITRAAGVSSTLTVTFAWTDGGASPTVSGAAITGNTTTTTQSGMVQIRVDEDTPISYSTTYGSVGAPTMLYQLDIVLERVAA